MAIDEGKGDSVVVNGADAAKADNQSVKADGLETSQDIVRVDPVFKPSTDAESPKVQSLIDTLSLTQHIEGGYFAVTDISPTSIPSPYPPQPLSERTMRITSHLHDNTVPATRLLSTTIFYFLTPSRPMGSFHKNRSRIIHTLHRGRGRYVLIHEDGRVETFVVGRDVEKGEKLQWVVEGGVYKASLLLEDEEGKGGSGGLLISETVVPGFDYADHEFLEEEKLREMVPEKQADALKWLIKDH
ncbi:cupin superfamily (DUF985) domain-containing protein [Sarocladium implicatum]|nr:cupin superfamily (DUF985) domain-containing protein [Sarocladium implicatum]